MQKIVVASDVKIYDYFKRSDVFQGIKTVKNYSPLNHFLCKIMYPNQKIFIKEVN